MEASENAVPLVPRASGLRPPSRYGMAASTASGGLSEISESDTNARSQIPSMLPQSGIKRPVSGSLSQPQAKFQRKTLADRAGEYNSKPAPSAAPQPAYMQSAVKGNSIAALSSSATASAIARPPSSAPSRHAPSHSWTASVGPGTRHTPDVLAPASSNSSKSVSGRLRAMTRQRPGTAMGNYREEGEVAHSKPQKPAWDVDERLRDVEIQFRDMKEVMNTSLTDKRKLEEAIDQAKTRAEDSERERNQLEQKNTALEQEIAGMRLRLQTLTLDLETEKRSRGFALEDKTREYRLQLDDLQRELKNDSERQQRDHRDALEALERHHRVELHDERNRASREIQDLRAQLGSELNDERIKASREVQELRTQLDSQRQDLDVDLQARDRDIQAMRAQIEEVKGDRDREQALKNCLQAQIGALNTAKISLETQAYNLQQQINYLKSDNKQQSDQFTDMQTRMEDALAAAKVAKDKLIHEETERRALFNKYQELKGNIRVMCRVRPVLNASEGEEARIDFTDPKTSTQLELTGDETSAMGTVTRKVMPFEFDRVFDKTVQNGEIFDEISQLVQSALDGYNVCIFCYGQTGSGKTYTMCSDDGVIPRATKFIYDTTNSLKEKSWSYTMEGSFVEVYNEELHDLLSPGREVDLKNKLEIRHDEVRKTTTVINCKTVRLDSADKVEQMLCQAAANRSVAATKANERSSRSHSVFILKLVGHNSATGETCEGTLNLVDLAGSERLKHSGAEGDRMRETQNINKSLSSLGDVIEALGKQKPGGFIPYRNSKLTHLLQHSLGGNSKTLMFVMVSPLMAHVKETVTSLRFATKVHNTHIGTAKSTRKLKGAE